ncbi:hypothetical protein F5148DRAFT_1282586 [Russula earlei]|uniref:Uncharacterized protein n=1 Tax=Russula earlei TaxID=71964 RepID=A0ACC0UG67_9AGAM|nr:hypothetical protein F5148DRAFT_1282586 [Russula earlei]
MFPPSPLLDNKEIDEDVGSVTGILVQGSNGEAQYLSEDEYKCVIRLTRETFDAHGYKDVAVIAGTGAQSTRETKQLNAKEVGATHALVLSPFNLKMNKDLIVARCGPSLSPHRDINLSRPDPPATPHSSRAFSHDAEQVADASPIPTMVYNLPKVTAWLDLDSDTITVLRAHPNKVFRSSLTVTWASSRASPRPSPAVTFAPFIRHSDSFLPALAVGGPGGIMAFANVVPHVRRALWDAWHDGRLD